MNINDILSLILVFLLFVVIVLATVYFFVASKEKAEQEKEKEKNTEKPKKAKAFKEYTTKSIYDFMEFDKIEDNMIIQKDGSRFLMAIECQGINYDLMSETEQNSIEIGFMKILNTLRTPIQLYIQTRTINLGKSLQNYRERLKAYQNDLADKQVRYNQMLDADEYNEEYMAKQNLEVIRQRNLCAYCNDIILNTEKMNLNKNILKKKYYIILHYYHDPLGNEEMTKSEIQEFAFSDLYTRCQSLIRSLYSAEIVSKVLNSEELVDLLYNAYNRDEYETYGTDKANEAEFDALYSTAPDILQRKMANLDAKIQQRAIDVAEQAIQFANEKLLQEINEKEESLEDMVTQLAKDLITENEEFFGEKTSELAKEIIDTQKKEKGDKANGKKTTRTKTKK